MLRLLDICNGVIAQWVLKNQLVNLKNSLSRLQCVLDKLPKQLKANIVYLVLEKLQCSLTGDSNKSPGKSSSFSNVA